MSKVSDRRAKRGRIRFLYLIAGLVGFSALFAGSSQFGRSASLQHKVTQQQAKTQEVRSPISEMTKQQILGTYFRLPLSFESNRGQTDSEVKYLARGQGYTLFLTSTEAVLALRHRKAEANDKTSPEIDISGLEQSENPEQIELAVVRMKLLGANPEPDVSGLEPLSGKVNYFIGSDPTKWHTNIPTYSKVKYGEVYPGIDLVHYGNQGQLEYDLVVGPGADPGQIKLAFEGTDGIKLDVQGDLILLTSSGGELRLHKPRVYQEANGITQRIAANYLLQRPGSKERQEREQTAFGVQVGFQIASYDRSEPLIIDPVLTYSTYLGGGESDGGKGIAVDASGNVYVTGSTRSTNFPTTNPLLTSLQATLAGYSSDVFVTKLNASGSALVYSTYLGGRESDWGEGIAVDASGNAYVTGLTGSTNFPTPTANPLQATFAGGLYDGFVTKLNASGSALDYSTYLGGGELDWGAGIAVDASGNAYVTGYTASTNFPTANPLQATHGGGGTDAFVAKISVTGLRVHEPFQFPRIIHPCAWKQFPLPGMPDCPPDEGCPQCTFSVDRQLKEIPRYLLGLKASIPPTMPRLEQLPEVTLDLILPHFKQAPVGRYFTADRKASLLKALEAATRSRLISPALSAELVEAINAVELDLLVPRLETKRVAAGKYSAVDFEGVAWVAFRDLEQSGEATLNIESGLPAFVAGLEPGWPISTYKLAFTGKLAQGGYLDVSFYFGGVAFSEPLSTLRLFEWDGKTYKDITTCLDLRRRIISGRTNHPSTFVIMPVAKSLARLCSP